LSNRTILIVDDEEDVRAITQMGLEMSVDWTVLTASSGKTAIAMATEHQPDVILLDWMMPDMDGRTTLQHLKSNPQTQAIPVILVTAKEQQSVEDLDNLAIAAMISKPFRPLKLAEQICQSLGWLTSPE
jgi:CheY-like chemotaxis protein